MSQSKDCCPVPATPVTVPLSAISLALCGVNLTLDGSALPQVPGPGTGECDILDYSLEEQFTGAHWINGDKIYRKTIDCGGLPNSTEKIILHGIVGLKEMIRLFGWASEARYKIPLPYSYETRIRLLLKGDDALVIESQKDTSSYKKAYVTIEYTRAESD